MVAFIYLFLFFYLFVVFLATLICQGLLIFYFIANVGQLLKFVFYNSLF